MAWQLLGVSVEPPAPRGRTKGLRYESNELSFKSSFVGGRFDGLHL